MSKKVRVFYIVAVLYRNMSLKSRRECAVKTLQTAVKPAIAKRYEKYIYTAAEADATCKNTSVKRSYSELAYELVGRFMYCKTAKDRKVVLEEIKAGTLDTWSTVLLNEECRKEYEEVSRTTKGVSVKKCAYKCKKPGCPSEECFTYQVQTRRADEGMTTYVVCVKCCSRYKFD